MRREFLDKLEQCWKLHQQKFGNGKFSELMADLVYRAEGHTDIALASDQKLIAEMDQLIKAGKWELR